MIIHKSYKFRLYPTVEQEQQFRQQCGNARFIWNYFLDYNQQHYQETGKFSFANDLTGLLPGLKKEYEFLKLSNSQSLQQVARHFSQALKAFLDPKRKNCFPKHKKKDKCRDSFTIPQYFRLEKKCVFISKIGEVQWVKHRVIKGKPKRIIISRDGNQWYCSVCCDLKIKQRQIKTDNLIGIDVGITTFATHSDGTEAENQKVMKRYTKKLRRTQRRLSRKQKGSNNRLKQKRKLNRLHRKVRRIRLDWQHKQTCQTIAKCDGVAVETLSITGMLSNHHLAKAVADCAWYEYLRQLEYKALWNGKAFVPIDRWEATSKCCSECGWKDVNLPLKDRIFRCQRCGLVMKRDLNAAINIRNAGIRILWDAQESSATRNGGTLGETRSDRGQAQCLSLNQEKECKQSEMGIRS